MKVLKVAKKIKKADDATGIVDFCYVLERKYNKFKYIRLSISPNYYGDDGSIGIGINWSSIGARGLDNTKKFANDLLSCIKLAENAKKEIKSKFPNVKFTDYEY